MREQILAAFSQYGSPVLFAVVLVASIGVPLPITLLLILTGSLVSQGVMDLWLAVALAGAGSVLGDLVGYAIGRWGGAAAVDRFSRLLGGPQRLRDAAEKTRRWGGAGIFFTRWLLSPLGPAVNLACGLAAYPWPRFVFWDLTGEFLFVAIYILLGRAFSDRVQALDAVAGDLTWAGIALAFAIALGCVLLRGKAANPPGPPSRS